MILEGELVDINLYQQADKFMYRGFDAGALVDFLSKHTPIAIPYTEPVDWSRYITMATGLLSTLLAVKFLSSVTHNKWSWAAGTVIVSLVMISGFMFTRIRGVPYTGGNGNWIAQGYQNQFGQEVQVVSFICKFKIVMFSEPPLMCLPPDGLLSFAFLMLIMVVPYQSSPHRQRIQIYLSWFVIIIVYSVLISLFRIKNRGKVIIYSVLPGSLSNLQRTGYPFKLLF
jgi:oligosaccharyltransferase complex subunit gamma